ncbi:hypothetical protein, partial [Enterovirga sp.]|uniref:GCG_CRPN prefix-to-repeats domain-containing protein n=1 Tax=Enterovirga sp. TaxID=2026350 RepID=UPI002C403A26
MKRTVPTVLGGAALLIGSAFGAQAMPLAPEPGAPRLVGKVSGGCGPGYFRDGWGYCRPKGGYYAPRPHYYYYRTRPYGGYGGHGGYGGRGGYGGQGGYGG